MSDDPIQMTEIPLARAQELRDKEKTLEHMQSTVPTESPVVMAHVIAEAIRELAEDAHQHRWLILSVWNPEGRPVHPRLLGNQATTVVLLRCWKCNLPETVELSGIWTEGQVRGGLPDVV